MPIVPLIASMLGRISIGVAARSVAANTAREVAGNVARTLGRRAVAGQTARQAARAQLVRGAAGAFRDPRTAARLGGQFARETAEEIGRQSLAGGDPDESRQANVALGREPVSRDEAIAEAARQAAENVRANAPEGIQTGPIQEEDWSSLEGLKAYRARRAAAQQLAQQFGEDQASRLQGLRSQAGQLGQDIDQDIDVDQSTTTHNNQQIDQSTTNNDRSSTFRRDVRNIVNNFYESLTGGGGGGAGGGGAAGGAGGGEEPPEMPRETRGLLQQVGGLIRMFSPFALAYQFVNFRRLTTQRVESLRPFAEVNAEYGYAFAQLEHQRIMRRVQQGRDTSASGRFLIQSLNELEEEMRPIETKLLKAANYTRGAFATVGSTLLGTANKAAITYGNLLFGKPEPKTPEELAAEQQAQAIEQGGELLAAIQMARKGRGNEPGELTDKRPAQFSNGFNKNAPDFGSNPFDRDFKAAGM